MAFPVNFGNWGLLKSVDLLRSKRNFAGKSGRIDPDSIHPALRDILCFGSA
jgi:hypothetical protein